MRCMWRIFGGDVLDRTGDNAKGGKERGVAVAGDDLCADRLGRQAQFLADVFFYRRVDVGEGADRAGDRLRWRFRRGPFAAGCRLRSISA